MKASHLGLAEYTATNFNREMTGDLVTVLVTTVAIPTSTPLDVTQDPGGSLWVAQVGSGQIPPSSTSATVDPDIDHDGVLNIADPFQQQRCAIREIELSREM